MSSGTAPIPNDSTTTNQKIMKMNGMFMQAAQDTAKAATDIAGGVLQLAVNPNGTIDNLRSGVGFDRVPLDNGKRISDTLRPWDIGLAMLAEKWFGEKPSSISTIR